jgi:hypothetical protein
MKSTDTNFIESSLKAQKLKLMMEELPTIEQMKKSLYNIYQDWLCPTCDMHKETFRHIWECADHNHILMDIKRNKTIAFIRNC